MLQLSAHEGVPGIVTLFQPITVYRGSGIIISRLVTNFNSTDVITNFNSDPHTDLWTICIWTNGLYAYAGKFASISKNFFALED